MEHMSFMDVFRKHQKVMMVALVAVSMFCFIVIDDVRQWDPRRSAPMVLAFIFGIAFWLWGLPDKKGHSFTLTGAAIGGIIGIIPLVTNQDRSGIATSIGRLSTEQLIELRSERQIANQFIAVAFSKRENAQSWMAQQYQFGEGSVRELVVNWLLRHEASQKGIRVSDKYINNYIQEVAENNFTREDFMKFRTDSNVNEVQLFDILREELQARIVGRLIGPEVVHLPEQYWRDFQKLNVSQSLDLTAIPVEQFTKKLDAPNDGELKALFEKHRSVYPIGATPGFRQPERLQLAWLEFDFETLEKQAGEISEDDLKKAYEEQKETRFRINALPELKGPGSSSLDSLKLDIPDLDGGAKPAAEKPASEKTQPAPESKDAGKKDADPAAPEKKDGEKKEPEQPAAEKKADEPAVPEKKAADGAATENNSNGACSDTADDKPAASENKTADADKSAEDKPAKDEPTKEDKPADKSAADKAADEKAAPATVKADDNSKKTDAAGDAKAETGEVKYRPFDEVREELQDIILNERTRKLIRERIEEATTALKRWREEAETKWPQTLSVENPAQAAAARVEASKFVAEKAEAWAKDKGVKFGQSGFLSYDELLAETANPLSTAHEIPDPSDFMAMLQGPQPIAQRLFRGVINTNFVGEEAEPAASSDSRLFLWIADRKEEHEPTFDEPGIRELVVKAWQAEKARPLAEKRAEELSKTVGEQVAAKPLAEVLTGQTVTGDTEGLQLSVIESGAVRWLREAPRSMQMNPFMQQPTLEMGSVPGVDKASDEFMKTIAEMPVGQVKVIPNADKSVYYVVHLKARVPESTDDPSAEEMKRRFIGGEIATSRVYDTLAQSARTPVSINWVAGLMRRYAVDLAALDSMDR